MSSPNVLWIMTDQHNFHALSCAGHSTVETPNIDRLADSGVRFSDAYSPAPVCGPARASLFSGQYPRATGFTGNNANFETDIELLPKRLRRAGYDTGLVGKLHLAPKNASHGFRYRKPHDAMYDCYHEDEPRTSAYVEWLADQRFGGDIQTVIERANEDERAIHHGDLYTFLMGTNWRSEAEHSNTWVTNRSIEYLREHRDDPFFLFTSYFGPHQPMLAPGKWAEMYDPEDVSLPPEFSLDPHERPIAHNKIESNDIWSRFESPEWTEARYREVLAAYYGQISMIDAGIGRLLDTLEEEGLVDETIVVFTADHGDHAGQFGLFFKGTMYEHSVRIPLVIRVPGGASGVRCEHVVNGLDLYSTVLESCGLTDDTTPAQSLRPLLDDPRRDDWVDETYSELYDWRLLVEDDLKLIRAMDDDTPLYELYDRTARPYDGENRWDDPELCDRRDGMVRRLERRQTQV